MDHTVRLHAARAASRFHPALHAAANLAHAGYYAYKHRGKLAAAYTAYKTYKMAGTKASKKVMKIVKKHRKKKSASKKRKGGSYPTPPRTPKRHKSGGGGSRGKAPVIRSNAFGESNSGTSIRYRKSKVAFMKVSEPTAVKCNTYGGLTTNPNSQNAFAPFGAFYGSYSVGSTSAPSGASMPVPNLLGYQYKDGANSLAPVIGVNDQHRKIFLSSFQSEQMITNTCQIDIILEIYDLVAKVTRNDTDGSGLSGTDPITIWTAAISREADTLTGQAYTLMGAKPTQYKWFNMNYDVVKKTTVEMAPGRTHRHTINWKVNRLIDVEYFVQYAMVKGISFTTMYVIRGATNVAKNLTGAYGIGTAQIAYEVTNQYHTKGVTNLPRKSFFFNNLPTDLAVASQKIINEGTDVVGANLTLF